MLGMAGPAAAQDSQEHSSRKGKDELQWAWFREGAIPLRKVIALPLEQAWAAAPGAFAQLGFPGGKSVQRDHVYLTPELRIKGRLFTGENNSIYIDCGQTAGGMIAADVYEIRFAILARFTATSDSTTLAEVVLDGAARDRNTSSTHVFCTGTGRIEAGLIDLIAKAAKQ